MKKWISTVIAIITTTTSLSVSAAGVFNIVPNSTSQIIISPTGSATLSYNITNNTMSSIKNITIEPAYKVTANYFTLNSQNNTCDGINLAPGASCTFQISIGGTSQLGSISLMPRVCGYSGVVCSVPIESNRVTVTSILDDTYTIGGSITGLITNGLVLQNNGGDNLSVSSGATTFQFPTPVVDNGSYNVTVKTQPTGLICKVSNGSGTNVTSNVTNVSITCSEVLYTAFIANGTTNVNTLSICPVNFDGSLGTCVAQNGNGFNELTGVAVNPAGTIVYVINIGNNELSICPINSNGTLGTCTTTNGNGTILAPTGISFNAAGTYLYISNGETSLVSICPVNSNGTIGTCTTSSGNGTFTNIQGITINTFNNYAYVVNSSSLSACPINANGSFGTCFLITSSTFSLPEGVSFNAAGTFAYVANTGNSTISICPINSNASLGTCTTSNGNGTFNFNSVYQLGVFMLSVNDFGYIPNSNNNTVSVCPINPSTGAFGTCVSSTGSNTLRQPNAIALGVI